jgi:hypothetical protein
MNTTQHTSGPWLRKGDWIHGTPESGASQGIAQILGNCGCTKTTEANARLISAAPALLSALELAADELDQWIGNDYADEKTHAAQNAARAAIAKARGGAK